jgi:hypothetical protein
MRVGAVGLALLLTSAACAAEPSSVQSQEETDAAPSSRPSATATIDVGAFPNDIAVGEGSVWVSVSGSGSTASESYVAEIDPDENRVVGRIPVPAPLIYLTAGEGGVWGLSETNEGGQKVFNLIRIDPQRGRIEAEVPGIRGPVAAGPGAIWATAPDDTTTGTSLVRIDPRTNRIVARIPLPESPWHISVGEGYVWVLALEPRQLDIVRIDANTNEVAWGVKTEAGTLGPPVIGDGSLWAPGWGSNVVVRINPVTNSEVARTSSNPHVPMTSPVGSYDGGIWFIGDIEGGQLISRLDAGTMRLDASLELTRAVARSSLELAADLGVMWVANYRESVTRIDLDTKD